MLTHITRLVAVVAVFSHNLLCGSLFCCAMTCSVQDMTCSVQDDMASVSHDSLLPVTPCPCHPEKQNHATGHDHPNGDHPGSNHPGSDLPGSGSDIPGSDLPDNKTSGCDDSRRDCDHPHHFCPCLQATPPNNGVAFRVILNPGLFALPVAFLAVTAPLPDWNHSTRETTGDSSALGVRLHLLLEHFLI